MSGIESLKEQVLALPPEERIELAEVMLLSVGPEYYEAVEAAWVAEAKDRIRAYDEGRMKAYSLEECKQYLEQRCPGFRAKGGLEP